MFRRLTSLLIVWFGLLTIIVPSVTCAAAASRGDCCPPEGAPPCGECPDKGKLPAPDQNHCVVSPVQAVASPAVAQSSARQGHSPDVLAIVHAPRLPTGATHCFAEAVRRQEYVAIFDSNAAFTYLVTGRLRL
jgi:hypothetical protein